ncbi:MAG: hypothetical protein A3F24_02330 [Candidatus Colwellbacteria bacterium RIFCSPHIGHO2_12_FULL_44_17]|uniref:Probable peptidoglycan glycosyltransferase FtsW n=1 Tax=Candidatus Colwellbacteria bacterium RIFCSPHIGHO2_12_FULL_44_17 TaxID=1797689 RepID=A0A1G1Z304_9BACT|nr:MAG: hypothetical protein A3F24_02330 [Candidatus Colwellbacteria bacterium RIFCSPHIGHO2_12_FULL_44_17]
MIRRQRIDILLFLTFILLTVFGLAMLGSASSDLGQERFDDPYYYLKHQMLYGFSIGVVGFVAFAWFINYKHLRKVAFFLLLLSIVTLILVLVPSFGMSSGVAQRWLTLGPITFQPSEFLKLTFIIYIAAWLSSSSLARTTSFSEGFFPFLLIVGFVAFLLLEQSSTSATLMITAITLAMYFVGGVKRAYIFYIFGAVLVAATLLFGFVYLNKGNVADDYRLRRIQTFLEPHKDLSGDAYQVNQALTVIGSGGLTGVGYGESLSKQYLPERIGDSIFAIIAEEWGFIGSVFVTLIFLFLVLRSFILARNTNDRFGKLLLVGFASLIGLQAFIHIGGNAGLVPLTGVPLPFISYGGTALAVFMTIAGIMLNISRNRG